MSDFNKIPFGLRESDNALVDVYDVPNGKQSGCICPSCHTPLEARQGDINVWHFAHSSKKVYEKTKNECEYSFYLSVRLMARQLIGKQIKLSLPECKGTIEYYEGVLRFTQWKEFSVSKEQDIILDDLEVENTFSGVAVDLIGTIGEFKFVVYLTHPERNVPDNLFSPTDSKCGVIRILLDLLHTQFKTAKSDGKTYHEILTDFLTTDRKSKMWIYHPRFEKAAALAIENLQEGAVNLNYTVGYGENKNHLNYLAQESYKNKLTNLPRSHVFNIETNQSKKMVNFECVMCKVKWEGYEAGGNQCPKCKNYLYSKQIT
ncbi:MAG: competence protein CoiA family protein [Methylobacter sp.]